MHVFPFLLSIIFPGIIIGFIFFNIFFLKLQDFDILIYGFFCNLACIGVLIVSYILWFIMVNSRMHSLGYDDYTIEFYYTFSEWFF